MQTVMIFSHQTRGAMAQVLSTISSAAAETFLYKHLGVTHVPSILSEIASAPQDAARAMLSEILANNKVLYGAAPVKNVFASAVEDLSRWALHDGWIVENGTLVRVTPVAEETTGIRDLFLEDIQASGLDKDNAIKNAVEDSSKNFIAVPPDFNGSATKVRIALETVARRAATAIAKKKGGAYANDSWGKALQFLRTAEVIEPQEEEILARVYTFISPGAHVPKGVTAEEWARLARTFGLSSAYFLLRKYLAA
jgi:hypothetical protein